MKSSRASILVIAFVLIAIGTQSYAQDKPAAVEMVTLKFRELEVVSWQKEPLLRSQPMIMSLIDRPLAINVVSTEASKFDESKHDIGMQFVANIGKLEQEKYELKLEWFRGQQLASKDDPDTETFVEEKLFTRTIVKSGEPKILRVSATKWYEITIFGPGKLPKQSSRNMPSPNPVPSAVPPNKKVVMVNSSNLR